MVKLIDITGKAIPGEWGIDDITGEGTPVLRTTNFTNHGVVDYSDVVTRNLGKKDLSAKYLRQGDIIIEKSGGSDNQPVGRVIYFDGPDNTYLFNNFTGLLRVRDQERWFPRYVFYALFSNYRRGGTKPFENRTTGLHNLQTESYVLRTTIQEAEYERQQEICDTLDRLKKVITLRQNQLRFLDTFIKARFVEMFGDHYQEDTLLNLCNIIDYRGKTPEKTEDGLPFITAKNVRMHQMSLEPREYISKETYDRVMVRGFPKEGDVVFTTEAPLGNVCRIPHFNTDFYIGQRIVTLQTEKLNPTYLEYALSTEEFKRKYMGKSSGSTVTGIRVRLLEQLTIPVPPHDLQNQFADFVAQVDKSKVVVQNALDEAQLLFDSLMQQYFG